MTTCSQLSVCWLATYTVTYGLVAFVACAVVAQVFSPTPQRMHRLTLFWAANIALVLAVYVPGLPDIHRGLPSPGRWLVFTLAYIGSPAAGLIWFPFDSQFDLPHATSVTVRNAVAGFILVAMLATKGYSLIRARERSPAARAFSAFALFALGSAVLTGVGRAQFGEVRRRQRQCQPFRPVWIVRAVRLPVRCGQGSCFAIGDRFTLERARSADCCCAAPAGLRNSHLRPLMESVRAGATLRPTAGNGLRSGAEREPVRRSDLSDSGRDSRL